MTRADADRIWGHIHNELSERLADVRPKLRSYDAALAMNRARLAVIAKTLDTDNELEIRAAALQAFPKFTYKRTSKFWTKEAA
jgi:hypothetical protein